MPWENSDGSSTTTTTNTTATTTILWRFGQFLGHGLPVAGVLQWPSFHNIRVSAPHSTYNLDSQDLSLSSTLLKTCPAQVALSVAKLPLA